MTRTKQDEVSIAVDCAAAVTRAANRDEMDAAQVAAYCAGYHAGWDKGREREVTLNYVTHGGGPSRAVL